MSNKGTKNHCVIIGDIKGSRKLARWQDIFKRLETTLKEVNQEFADDILMNFEPTVGDEFQGILINADSAYLISVAIKNRVPADMYLGIGIGEVEKLSNENVGMRGTAFYRARSALELCKKRKRGIIIKSSDVPNYMEDIINTLLYFINSFEKLWTKRQREIVNYFRLHPDYTYTQLSRYFKISKQSISQILKAANWNVVSEGELSVNKLLKILPSANRGIDVKDINFTNKSKANLLDKEGVNV